MQKSRFTVLRTVTALSLITAAGPLAFGQGSHRAHQLINSKIDDAKRTVRYGNVRSAANAANDRGAVSDSLPMPHILIALQRSPESEAAFESYLATLNDQTSPNFHKWLTAQEIGSEFGPAQSDLDAVTGWLKDKGFTVNGVAPTAMSIDISGSAAQVRSAFGTEIHNLSVNGVSHIANMQEPSIPSALAGVVLGPASLNDFRPQPMHHNVSTVHFDPRTSSQTTEGTAVNAAGAVHPSYTYTSGSSTYQAVVPGDLATIYNLNPLFAAGVTGTGQTIVVIEDTNVYSTADWTTFRSTFGLSQYTSGTFTQVHPTGSTHLHQPR